LSREVEGFSSCSTRVFLDKVVAMGILEKAQKEGEEE
jgi:hypothetical protein